MPRKAGSNAAKGHYAKYGLGLLVIGVLLIAGGYFEPQIANAMHLSGFAVPVQAVAQQVGGNYVFQISVAQGSGQVCLTDNTQNTNICTSSTQNVPVNLGDSVTFSFNAAAGYAFDHYYVNGGSGVSGTQNPVSATIVAQGNCGGSNQSLCSLAAFFIPSTQTPALSVIQESMMVAGAFVVAAAVILLIL